MKLTAWNCYSPFLRKGWMIMRITTLLILIFALHVSAKTSAQTITLSSDKITVEQFFNQLKKQTGYSFLLENGVVSPDQTLSVHVNNASLEQALDQVLKPLSLGYRVENKIVYIIKSTNPGFQAQANLSPPPGDIHGRVTDSTGAPLSGASVTVRGSKRGTVTNSNGEFSLKGVKDDATIVVSFTGYIQKEFRPDVNGNINGFLSRSNNPLDAVVIIPYGTTTARLNTGDISTVTAKTISEQPVPNALAAMEGRVPGLIISQTTGNPGGGYKVQIRGQNSLLNGSDPFYVVDGVPYSSQTVGTATGLGLLNNNLGGGSPLNYINPGDIESIEILKDADATSIYGSRAANGAILITTKKGRTGPVKVDLNVYDGIGNNSRNAKLLNTQQYLEMRNEAFRNDNETPIVANAPDLLLWDTARYTDWQKVLTGNTAHYLNAQGTISGGNQNTQYLVAFGYNRQSTVYPTAISGQGANQQGSVNFNINTASDNKKFKMSFTGIYTVNDNTVQPNDFSVSSLNLAPDAPNIYNPDGSLNWEPKSPGQIGTFKNPYAALYKTYDARTSNEVGNAILSYNILTGLDIRASFGYTNTQTDEVSTTPNAAVDPAITRDTHNSAFNSSNTHTWIIEPQINYQHNIGQGVLTALVGSTFNQSNSQQQQIFASGFVSDALLSDLQAATNLSTSSAYNQYNYEAIFGRINYNWADKYILNINGRRDGSSRFGPGNQFANFGSVGAAWIFSREKWVSNNLSFLSFGKIRGSYGTTGNDQIPDYRYLNLYSLTPSDAGSYQGTQGLYSTSLFNPNLAWEESKKLEVGIELGFLKDRIYISADYYRNRSNNQLVNNPLPSITGFTSVLSNLNAVVQNSGFEFVLNTMNIKSGVFSWSSSINLSIPRNKLISFPGLESSGYAQAYVIGQPVNVIKEFHYIGVNDTTGIYQFADSKGNPTYTPNYNTDRTTLINTNPEFYGGFLNSFHYKGFSLDVFFQFTKQTGINIYNQANPPGSFLLGIGQNMPAIVMNRWQKPGDIKPLQQFTQDGSSTAYQTLSYYGLFSDLIYSDASYIRLKNVALSYTIPGAWQQKMHVRECRIYMQAQNLLTITSYNGFDPETQGTSLPPLRVWTLGLQIGL